MILQLVKLRILNKKLKNNQTIYKVKIVRLFFLILIFVIFGIFFSKIRINIKEFIFDLNKKEIFTFKIEICIYLYNILKIKIISLTEFESKFLWMKYSYIKLFNRLNLNKNPKLKFKNLKIKTEQLKLFLNFGFENPVNTAYFTALFSSIISYFLSKTAEEVNNKKYEFKLIPNYNFINFKLKFSSKFSLNFLNLL